MYTMRRLVRTLLAAGVMLAAGQSVVTTPAMAAPVQHTAQTVCAVANTLQAARLGGSCGVTAFAHRGVHNDSVAENTRLALDEAYRADAHTETDVFLTKDSQELIHHDRTLDRMTNCSGLIADWTLADIKAQCWIDVIEGERHAIPTFNQYAKWLAKNSGQRMMVEVKGAGWFDANNADIVDLRDTAERHGVHKRVYFTNDATERLLEAFRDSAPDARTAWKPYGDSELTTKYARNLSVNAVMFNYGQLTRSLVRTFKDAGFGVWARKANEESEWDRLIRLGVKAAMTDKPFAFRKNCNQEG